MSAVKKVLIVDDDRTVHTMLKVILGANGFEVSSAMTGEEGLKAVVEVKPDIIILDVMMPTIKGREVCKRLKADPLTAAIPVLFLTAKDSDDDVQAEVAAGAVGHVTKPVSPNTLVRLIKQILGL